MGPGKGGDGERSDHKPRRLKDKKGRQGRAEPESQADLGQGVGKRVSNQGRGKPRSLRSICRASQRDSGYGREMPPGERGKGWEGLAGQRWILKDGLAGYLALGMAMCPLVSLIVKNLI